jgi:hypothetical protein
MDYLQEQAPLGLSLLVAFLQEVFPLVGCLEEVFPLVGCLQEVLPL